MCAVLDAVVARLLHGRCSYAVVLMRLVMLAVLNVLRVASSALTVASPRAVPLRAGGALPCPVAGGGWGVGAVVAQGLGAW